VIDQLDLDARCSTEVGHGRGWQTTNPEECIDLAILDGVDRLGDAEALALHILSLSRPAASITRNAMTSVALPARTGRYALAFEVGYVFDARPFDRDHMHLVRIEHHQRANRDFRALEFVLALVGIKRSVNHREGDFAVAGIDQLEIVDRSRRSLQPWPESRQRLRQNVGETAAERIVDAAGAAVAIEIARCWATTVPATSVLASASAVRPILQFDIISSWVLCFCPPYAASLAGTNFCFNRSAAARQSRTARGTEHRGP
jgi:hypothetical protein